MGRSPIVVGTVVKPSKVAAARLGAFLTVTSQHLLGDAVPLSVPLVPTAHASASDHSTGFLHNLRVWPPARGAIQARRLQAISTVEAVAWHADSPIASGPIGSLGCSSQTHPAAQWPQPVGIRLLGAFRFDVTLRVADPSAPGR